MRRGDTYEFDAQITRTAAGVTVPLDLTGYTGAALQFMARNRWTDAAARITKIQGDGITITDGPNGRVHVRLAPADTDAWADAPVILFWRIVATHSPDVWTALSGTLEIVNG